MVEFKNILIVKWGALGDFIAATPAIVALRRHWPHARLTLLTDAKGAEICPPGSIVDEVIDRKRFKSGLKLARHLRAQYFDLAINLKWSSEGAFLLSWFAADKTAGGGPHWWARFYDFRVPPADNCRHEYHKNLDMVERLGVPAGEPQAYIHVSGADASYAEAFLAGCGDTRSPLLVMAPGASKAEKRWTQEGFAEIGRRFVQEMGGRVVVTWAPNELALAEEVVAAIGTGAWLAPRTTYRQLAALTARASLCLCNNSGIMHVAYAMGTPFVCLNASVSWAPYPPLGVGVNAFSPPDLAKQGLGPEAARALADIGPDEVWQALCADAGRVCVR